MAISSSVKLSLECKLEKEKTFYMSTIEISTFFFLTFTNSCKQKDRNSCKVNNRELYSRVLIIDLVHKKFIRYTYQF